MNKMDFSQYLNYLLFEHKLVVKDAEFRIVEIEFYLYNQDHLDSYTHCSKYQLKNEEFYFHRFRNGTPKEGTFKGMDVCFGHPTNESYFGVLIRSIENLATGEVIEGPCKTVNKILELHGLQKCIHLVKQIIDGQMSFHVKQCPLVKFVPAELEKRPLWSGPRIGLSDKYPDWKNKPYRIISSPKVKKGKRSLTQMPARQIII